MPSTRITEGFKAFRSPSEDAGATHSQRVSATGEAQDAAPCAAYVQPQADAAVSVTTSVPKIPHKPDSAPGASRKGLLITAPVPPPARTGTPEYRPAPAAAASAAAPVVPTGAASEGRLVAQNGMLVPSNRFCFSGLYEDVDYKVETLFAPPVPADAFPPRVRPPRRPGPVWRNNLDEAGMREHQAQMKISKIWRGVLLRRELKRSRTFEHILDSRATRIQCWWRCVRSVQRRHQLAELKSQWVQERGNSYVQGRLAGMTNMMTWQRKRYEHAAVLLQRVIRWHLRNCERQRLREAGRPEAEWPEALPLPVHEKSKVFFPWRRSEKTCAAVALQNPATALAVAAATAAESTPQDRAVATHPLSETDILAANEKMRARQLALTMPSEEVVSRTEWKQEGLRQRDLDFNAGVLQRAIKRHMDSRHVRSEKLTTEYMNNVYRIIARSFRLRMLKAKIAEHRSKRDAAVQRKREQYIKDRVARIQEEGVWGRSLQDAAALTIQRCWFWYRYEVLRAYPGQPVAESVRMNASPRIGSAQTERLSGAERPATYRAGFLSHVDLFEEGLPTPPPYHLLDEHIQRVQELRRAELPAWQRK